MKKILVLTGSNHSASINVQLNRYAASKLKNSVLSYMDMTQIDFPMYSIDFEQANGLPESVQNTFNDLQQYDGYLIASPEHNGNVPAVFKNFIDWMTRVDRRFLGGKPTLVLATSPGPGAAASVRSLLSNSLPHFGGAVTGSFGLPSFSSTFSEAGIGSHEVELDTVLNIFESEFITEIA